MQDKTHNYMLPFDIYTFLKWFALLGCPALATFIGTIAPTWHIIGYEPYVTTINAVGLFIGGLLGLSQISATPSELKESKYVDENAQRKTNL